MSGGGVYFPVRAGFCRDRAARALRRRHGAAGLGCYVILLCLLLEEPGAAMDVSTPDGMDDLAEEFGVARDECAALLSDMASGGLVDPDSLADGMVRCHVTDEACEVWRGIVEKRRAAARSRWSKERRPKGADR